MKKIIKVLIFLILICIVLNITLSRYVEEKSDISRRLGNVWTGAQISTYNYAAISKNFELYKNCILKEDYENAYKFLSYEYKKYKSIEEYINAIQDIHINEFEISKIIRRTEKMYSITLTNGNSEVIENLMIFNEDNTSFSIVPETFIEYKEYNKKIKKKKVEYELVSTVNHIDKFVASINITNLSKSEVINISDIELVKNDVKHISGNLNEVEINPNETKNITIEFKTYIAFPEKLEITRYIEKKEKTEKYTFDLIEK